MHAACPDITWPDFQAIDRAPEPGNQCPGPAHTHRGPGPAQGRTGTRRQLHVGYEGALLRITVRKMLPATAATAIAIMGMMTGPVLFAADGELAGWGEPGEHLAHPGDRASGAFRAEWPLSTGPMRLPGSRRGRNHADSCPACQIRVPARPGRYIMLTSAERRQR
jgi:hypothetical protein